MFVPEAGCSSLEKLAADQKTDEWFLEQLTRHTQQGRNFSDKSTAHNFAPKKLSEERGPGRQTSEQGRDQNLNGAAIRGK